MEVYTGNHSRNEVDPYMSYAVVRMQKVKSAGLKGMQFHNQRERKSLTNDDIDEEKSGENYDLENDENINYNERVKEIIDEQKIGTRKTRKDAVLVNELLVTSDRKFFERLDPDEQERFFEESHKLFSERYGKQNIAYATVHVDEQTPHMHLGVVPMREGRLQGKNVFNRQELLWLQENYPKHMQELGFNLERGEMGSNREHVETSKFKKLTLEKDIDLLEKSLGEKKSELSALNEKIPDEIEVSARRQFKQVEVKSEEKNFLGIPKKEIKKTPTGNVVLSEQNYKELVSAANGNKQLKGQMKNILSTDLARENKNLRNENKELESMNNKNVAENFKLINENDKLKDTVRDLTNEIGNIYQTAKEFIKERTNDLQAFKSVFGGLIGKIKEKMPKSEIGRLHDRSEAKEKNFDMSRVKELDKIAKKQKALTKRKEIDLEL